MVYWLFNPEGNKLKKNYDECDIEELKVLALENNVKLKDQTKDELIIDIIKKKGGISKMKVNNQVASNPIGFFESQSNFCDLPCRLITLLELILINTKKDFLLSKKLMSYLKS